MRLTSLASLPFASIRGAVNDRTSVHLSPSEKRHQPRQSNLHEQAHVIPSLQHHALQMKKLVWLAFEYRDVGFQEQRIQCLEAPFVEQKALKSKDKTRPHYTMVCSINLTITDLNRLDSSSTRLDIVKQALNETAN